MRKSAAANPRSPDNLPLYMTMTHLAQIPLETYLLAQQAAPIACLVCDHENCCSAARCRNCSGADVARAQLAVGEEAAALDRRHRRQRRRQDRVPRPADGHADAARRPAALDRPRADVDLAAANDDDGARHRLVPGKDRDHPRTLALGALSIQLPAAPPAAGAGDSRPFGRSAGDRNRARRPLSGDPLAADQVRRP